MLKILIVSVGKLSGGVESYTLTLGKLLENKGYEVQLKWNDKIGDEFRYWANFNISLYGKTHCFGYDCSEEICQ